MRGGEEQQFNSVTPAIYPATTYLREPDGSYPRGQSATRGHHTRLSFPLHMSGPRALTSVSGSCCLRHNLHPRQQPHSEAGGARVAGAGRRGRCLAVFIRHVCCHGSVP
eukprot:3276679-Rhodomonas_salina.2